MPTGIEIFIAAFTGLFTALGGFEMIKYFIDWIKTRKTTKVKDETDATTLEVEPYKQQNEFLLNQLKTIQEFNQNQITQMQTQIVERDAKIECLTLKVEELQRTINQLFNENQEIKKKLVDNSCTNLDCTSRKRIINS